MDVDPWTVECQDCDFRETLPGRDRAEHRKRVHEYWYDHTAFLERPGR